MTEKFIYGALELAELLETAYRGYNACDKSAVELRRLHARAEELENRLEIDHQHGIDGIEARDFTIRLQDALIDDLKSQLEAIHAKLCEVLEREYWECETRKFCTGNDASIKAVASFAQIHSNIGAKQ